MWFFSHGCYQPRLCTAVVRARGISWIPKQVRLRWRRAGSLSFLLALLSVFLFLPSARAVLSAVVSTARLEFDLGRRSGFALLERLPGSTTALRTVAAASCQQVLQQALTVRLVSFAFLPLVVEQRGLVLALPPGVSALLVQAPG